MFLVIFGCSTLLNTYLEWNGFEILHKFGSFEEEAFCDYSEKQIFVCQ